jgi:hypothetical protein
MYIGGLQGVNLNEGIIIRPARMEEAGSEGANE